MRGYGRRIQREHQVWFREQPPQRAREVLPERSTNAVDDQIEIRAVEREDVAFRPEIRATSPVSHQPIRR
jgi:hypothetical protein